MIDLPTDGALSCGEWWGYSSPFRHWRASQVLDASAYRRVSEAFNALLETTAGRREGSRKLVKSIRNYDALILGIDEDLAPVFSPFFSEAWLGSLHRFLSLPELGRIDGRLHSSPNGSRTGWIHTDLCSAWFDESSPPTGPFLFPNRSRCDYFTGRRNTSTADRKEYVRAATLIYYLCNDEWKPGDGGETALYSTARLSERTTVELVAPVNNTLLLFECSPHSYHRFVTNPGCTRNSIILWLHTSVEHARARWGDTINRRASP